MVEGLNRKCLQT